MELYKTRSQIGTNETCVYVCLQLPDHPYPSWFSIWPERNKTRTKRRGHKLKFKQNSSGNLLVPIPSSSSHSSPISHHSTIAVGSEIYVIGGPHSAPSTSSVRILDCRSHTWRDAPDMNVTRKDASVAYLGEKIYVMGDSPIDESVNLFEVVDIKTQSWTDLLIHDDKLRNELRRYSILNVVEGKLNVVAETKDYTYEPKEGTWEVLREPSSAYIIEVWCLIENVMYRCTYAGYLEWYDSECREWKVIEGLEELREHRKRGLKPGCVREIVNYCGNILVMWSPYPTYATSSARRRKNKVWYAEISLEIRCNGSEVWGNVEWVDAMFTVPREKYEFLHCLTVSV